MNLMGRYTSWVLFTRVRGIGILGSSLSSGTARMRLRICHKARENGIGDASLEAPQRLLAVLALRDLLAVVGSAPGIRPGFGLTPDERFFRESDEAKPEASGSATMVFQLTA